MIKRAHQIWQQWIWKRNHLIQAFIWCGLGFPTIIWWKESILWVAMMSLYANIESSLAAHGADREKQAADKRSAEMSEKLDKLYQLVERRECEKCQEHRIV